jgi:hypothetical protein
LVGTLIGGVCALAFGTSIVEAVIESIKNIAIVIAAILFFSVFILFFLFLSFCLNENVKNYQLHVGKRIGALAQQ